MSKLSDALGMGDEPMPEDSEAEAMVPMEEESKASPEAEVLAMKQFKRAKTPEDMASALRSFLEACGVY